MRRQHVRQKCERERRVIERIAADAAVAHLAIARQRDFAIADLRGERCMICAVDPVRVANDQAPVKRQIRRRIGGFEFPVQKMAIDDFETRCEPFDRL